jgi:hypothetical protein
MCVTRIDACQRSKKKTESVLVWPLSAFQANASRESKHAASPDNIQGCSTSEGAFEAREGTADNNLVDGSKIFFLAGLGDRPRSGKVQLVRALSSRGDPAWTSHGIEWIDLGGPFCHVPKHDTSCLPTNAAIFVPLRYNSPNNSDKDDVWDESSARNPSTDIIEGKVGTGHLASMATVVHCVIGPRERSLPESQVSL